MVLSKDFQVFVKGENYILFKKFLHLFTIDFKLYKMSDFLLKNDILQVIKENTLLVMKQRRMVNDGSYSYAHNQTKLTFNVGTSPGML